MFRVNRRPIVRADFQRVAPINPDSTLFKSSSPVLQLFGFQRTLLLFGLEPEQCCSLIILLHLGGKNVNIFFGTFFGIAIKSICYGFDFFYMIIVVKEN